MTLLKIRTVTVNLAFIKKKEAGYTGKTQNKKRKKFKGIRNKQKHTKTTS